MSLQIYIAHTGERSLADPVSFASPDALRSWIARTTSISPQRQILMTARGKHVKLQTLLTENEIFVYDRKYVTPSNESDSLDLPDTPSPPSFKPQNPPDTLSDQNNLQAWRILFMARRTWALTIAEECTPMTESVRLQDEQSEIIGRAVGVALENLKSHVTNLEQKFEDTQTWANNLLRDQKVALDDWQKALSRLDKIPARKDFAFLLRRPSTPKRDTKESSSTVGTLQDFVELAEVQSAGSQGSTSSQRFRRLFKDVEQAVKTVVSDTQTLLDKAHRDIESLSLNNDEVSQLFDEIETFAKKISSDYEHILSLPNTSKTLSNVSRMALVHTKDLLPSLTSTSIEINQALQQAVKQRNSTMRNAVHHMQAISTIESELAALQTQLSHLELDPEGAEAFDTLDTIFRLPVVYGSVLIESVRRKEWTDKMKADSMNLAEEMAAFKAEEQRRRTKWINKMADFLATQEVNTALGIEVNLQGQAHEWPEVTRKEIDAYVEDLKARGMGSEVQELSQLVKELDSPTRHQRRRAQNFKNGSAYDASLGRSSLLLRGDDDMIRSLKDEKTKLEDKLKGSESRVRKLEDLLHRQSQMGRPVSGVFGPSDLDRHSTSPGGLPSPRPPDALSRRSSVSSRRLSSNQTAEDKVLVQRIVVLEAELIAEKDIVSKLQKEAHAERRSSTESRDKMQEAESTKKDLMDNLEAQQREFDDERRLLEDETGKLKLKLEEVEAELDRVLGSRDHEKSGADQRIRELQTDLDKVRKDSGEEVQKAQGQVDFMRNDYTLQRDRANTLEKRLQQQEDDKAELQAEKTDITTQLRNLELSQTEHFSALQAAHLQLSPDGSPPEDFGRLVKAIEILSEGLAIHARGSEEAAALASADNKTLEEKLGRAETEIEQLKEKLGMEEMESFTLRETLAQEKNKLSTLRSELSDEQTQLRTLRSKFAAGETGSEALKERVADKEREVADLSEKLSIADSHAKSFEQEILLWKNRIQNLTESEHLAKSRLEARGHRAKDLSQRLYFQNDRMIRILEQLGYSVSRQDDAMVIQRASKVSASTTLGEFSTAMNRSISGGSPSRPYANPEELEKLYWMQVDDPQVENEKYMAFANSLGKFDLDAFGEAIVKRMKDIEVLARKWQKEARAYRDKSHRSQGEAHEKIAFRSFKEGDLALFLPTRNQAIRSWAAFNVGAPHYFLREQDSHKLQTRDWLVARISKLEERVVDLSKSMNGFNPERRSIAEASDGASFDDENPFELSDGLRWYMIDAIEEKPGAPSTPGLGKSTVASTNVDVKGSVRLKRPTNASGATKTLSKSLDSRRSSSNSKKGVPTIIPANAQAVNGEETGEASRASTSARPPPEDNVQPAVADMVGGVEVREDAPIFEEDMGGFATKENFSARPVRSAASTPSKGQQSLHSHLASSPTKGKDRSVRTTSPSKQPSVATIEPKSKAWDKLWSIDYRLESGDPGKK